MLTPFADTSRLHRALLNPEILNTRPVQIQIQHTLPHGSIPLAPKATEFKWNAAAVDSKYRPQTEQMSPRGGEGGRGGALFSSTAVVLGSAICLWLLLFGLIGSLYFHLHSSTSSFKEELRPQLQAALSHASSVLEHLDRAATNADHILFEADVLEKQAVPGILDTINNTATVLHRLEAMSHNPVLKLSLGS